MRKWHVFLNGSYQGWYWADMAIEAKSKFLADTGYQGNGAIVVRED